MKTKPYATSDKGLIVAALILCISFLITIFNEISLYRDANGWIIGVGDAITSGILKVFIGPALLISLLVVTSVLIARTKNRRIRIYSGFSSLVVIIISIIWFVSE